MKAKTPTINVSPRFSLRLAPALIVAALIACCPLRTPANTIALSFTTGAGTIVTNLTLGWAFSLSSATQLTDLGLWDGPNGFLVGGGSAGDGFGGSHLVTVWTSTGTQEAQTTIPAGTSGTLIDGFRYVSILPVLLPAGDYTIGVFADANNTDAVAIQTFTVTTASGVRYDESRFTSGNTFPPRGALEISNSYFGPNFQFTAPTSVPDSASTCTLLLLALTAIFGLKVALRGAPDV